MRITYEGISAKLSNGNKSPMHANGVWGKLASALKLENTIKIRTFLSNFSALVQNSDLVNSLQFYL